MFSKKKKSYEEGNDPRGGGGGGAAQPGEEAVGQHIPIRVCAAQRGRDFEAPDLERGIHFRGVF